MADARKIALSVGYIQRLLASLSSCKRFLPGSVRLMAGRGQGNLRHLRRPDSNRTDRNHTHSVKVRCRPHNAMRPCSHDCDVRVAAVLKRDVTVTTRKAYTDVLVQLRYSEAFFH